MSKNSSKAIVCLASLVIIGWQPPVIGREGWREKMTSIFQRGEQAKTWGGGHKELIELAGCLAQIPGILATDSNSALAIKAAALLNLATTDIKILKELFQKQDGCLAKQCVYNIPKMLAYTLATRYDHLRLTLDSKELVPGSPEIKKLHALKVKQFFQLGIEILFRVFAYMDSREAVTPGRVPLAKYLSEAADWVELWRLIDRMSVLNGQGAVSTVNSVENVGEIGEVYATTNTRLE